MTETDILRYAAFTDVPEGGNPAGVVLDATGLDEGSMVAIAAGVGYSETAFLLPTDDVGTYDVRYFSPLAEVPFCGHATIATAVALADRGAPDELVFRTQAGLVPVRVDRPAGGGPASATLTSVEPSVAPVADSDLAEALAALGWAAGDLDAALPPRVAYAGAHHLVLAAATRERLATLDYDFEALRTVMVRAGWTTVDLVWRDGAGSFHARNPFPVGGVIEDPATGAAAAAFGAYLRDLGAVVAPASISIRQGEDMGRPSRLLVTLDETHPRVRVSGQAVPIEDGKPRLSS